MDEINMDEALGEISEGLGFGESTPVDDTVSDDPVVSEEAGEALEDTSAGEEETTEVEETEESTDEPPVESIRPPDTWRPDAAKEFASLPKIVQDEILKRESDISKGIETYKTDATIGKVFKEVMGPYIPICREQGVDPMHQVQSLMQAHQILSTKPVEEKRVIFQKLMQAYGIDSLNPVGDSSAGDIDPHLSTLMKEVDTLKSQLYSQNEREVMKVRQSLQQEIDTFASDPANPHFELVVEDMTNLIRGGLANNLKDAYEQAVWRNPTTRELELSRKAAEQTAQQKQSDSTKVKLVKKAAGVNVVSSSSGVSGAAPLGTMDETLQETLKALKAKS